MSSGDKFNSILVSSIAAVIAILILSITSYNINRNNKILTAIEAGASPIDAAIAFDNIYIEKIAIAYLGKK